PENVAKCRADIGCAQFGILYPPERIKWQNRRHSQGRHHPFVGWHRSAVSGPPWLLFPGVFSMWLPLLAALSAAQSWLLYAVLAVVAVLAFIELCGLRVIPNDKVVVVESLWSPK